MDAATIRADLAARGIQIEAVSGGIRVTPKDRLTDALRRLIVDNKPALLQLLAGDEIRAHVARVFPDHPEAAEVLAVALANPDAALDALRLAKDREGWAVGMNPEGRA